MKKNPSLVADAIGLFADLQSGIVERTRTIERDELGRGASGPAQLANIFELPAIVTTLFGPDGGMAQAAIGILTRA